MMGSVRAVIDNRFTAIVFVSLLGAAAYAYGYRHGRAAATEPAERIQRSETEGDQDPVPDQIESDVTAEDLLEGVR